MIHSYNVWYIFIYIFLVFYNIILFLSYRNCLKNYPGEIFCSNWGKDICALVWQVLYYILQLRSQRNIDVIAITKIDSMWLAFSSQFFHQLSRGAIKLCFSLKMSVKGSFHPHLTIGIKLKDFIWKKWPLGLWKNDVETNQSSHNGERLVCFVITEQGIRISHYHANGYLHKCTIVKWSL